MTHPPTKKRRCAVVDTSPGIRGGYLLSHFRSTIGAAGFNFSVRNGKRWIPRAMAALVLFFAWLAAMASALPPAASFGSSAGAVAFPSLWRPAFGYSAAAGTVWGKKERWKLATCLRHFPERTSGGRRTAFRRPWASARWSPAPAAICRLCFSGNSSPERSLGD